MCQQRQGRRRQQAGGHGCNDLKCSKHHVCRCFMIKEIDSTHLSGLKHTHNEFLVSNTNFIYKKTPQSTFNSEHFSFYFLIFPLNPFIVAATII